MPVTKYPEDSFAWYMEGDKLAIVYIDSGVSYCSLSDYTNKQDCEDAGGSWYSGGKSSTGEYDTYDGATKGDAIRVHYHGRYNKIQHIEDDLKYTEVQEGFYVSNWFDTVARILQHLN